MQNTSPILHLETFPDYQTYKEKSNLVDEIEKTRFLFQKGNLKTSKSGGVFGYCLVCESSTEFQCRSSDVSEINFREELICPTCSLNNRLRACYHYFKQHVHPSLKATDFLYLPEQRTPFYNKLKSLHSETIGSEYLGNDIPLGKTDYLGIRNEDVTNLTFTEKSLNSIICLEVLEHVPDYHAAISEFYRCTKPGGTLLITVPFLPNTYKTLIRAQLQEDGCILHLEEKEYHGDPNSDNPCLCFYHFGWDLLDTIKEVGFSSVSLKTYWDLTFGFLGNHQSIIVATKTQ